MPTQHEIAHWARRSHADRLAGQHFSRAKRLHDGRPNGYWSGRQWLALLVAHDHRCYYCGEYLPDRELTPDHVIPLSRGGKNAITNIVPACRRCNSAKGDKSGTEYVEYLAAKQAREERSA